ncbi:ribonuclease H-like domain-containing protein [Verrucomicrobiaceae bacterium R5-34]|uniref:Ribonuclease H-like domain-containing protein n=1 Tax=Oceaniferula flava TaxID=2800421 RepID=A0AAE2SDU6_9BACT|nr:ribonuclease H-like domain-containing protein [Oceaniferula flavus]MBK1829901.1 ribonuclease H-like domain-containing protein [Verrucomicrobiaceae bacterium R5-34]MBK1856370.1 ribonuclease H-like domain-containing protein [Oceaniferula flavus]MBM1137677.1 ribonuclease H-like domain-containing protein [Oceaniferula flavus]
MRDIVYFDLETQRSFGDVGGAKNKDKMGISVGVAYSTRTGQYHIFGENQTDELVDMLIRADLVVGYNHIYFDYPVLQGYTILDLPNQTINLDMLLEVEKLLGHRLKLDAIASASLGMGKSADGLDALRWWQEYKKTGNTEPMMKIAEYCCYDVKVTKEVHEFGIKNGFLKYNDRNGNPTQVDVDWT